MFSETPFWNFASFLMLLSAHKFEIILKTKPHHLLKSLVMVQIIEQINR